MSVLSVAPYFPFAGVLPVRQSVQQVGRTSFAVNSGPLSDLRYSGGPCRTNRSASTSSTSCERILRATTIARHSLVCSSSTVSSFSARPSCVLEATKSYDQTWPRYSGLSRMHDPSVEPQPTSLRLPLRHLQPLLPPDPLHPLVLHPPALDAEHVRDASVAVAAESTRESHDITSERPLVTRHFPRPALGRAWLPEHPARSPLRRPELLTYTHHTTSSALGAQKFPSAASSSISLSSVKSATARFRRPFSRSRSFRRRAPGSPSSRRTPTSTRSTSAR